MIVDASFPILNETKTGVVHVMQHALLCAVKVKRSLNGSEIEKIRDIIKLEKDKAEPLALSRDGEQFWSSPHTMVLAFRSKATLQNLIGHFYKKPITWCNIHMLEHRYECGGAARGIGALICIEYTNRNIVV